MGRNSYLTETTRFCNCAPPPRGAQLNYSNPVMKDAYQRHIKGKNIPNRMAQNKHNPTCRHVNHSFPRQLASRSTTPDGNTIQNKSAHHCWQCDYSFFLWPFPHDTRTLKNSPPSNEHYGFLEQWQFSQLARYLQIHKLPSRTLSLDSSKKWILLCSFTLESTRGLVQCVNNNTIVIDTNCHSFFSFKFQTTK